jgi:hypothetical protein
MDNSFTPADPFQAPVEDALDTDRSPSGSMTNRGRGLKVVALSSVVAGGLAAAAILGPLSVQAASPSPAATSAPTTTGEPTTGAQGGTAAGDNDQDGNRGPGGPGRPGGFGHNETTTDTSVVAKAIGISEADLTTALSGGQTVAAVAKAHSVDTQVVIGALTKDGLDELAAQVKAGTITQAQADAGKAEVTRRATDQVNGSFGHH